LSYAGVIQRFLSVMCLIALMIPGVRPALAGYAAIVIDQTNGQVLDEVNADEINHPASLTKMMTLYLTFEALERGRLRLDQPLHVSEFAAAKSATKLGLEPGGSVTVRECVLGMIVLSANDAATVVAEALGGTEEAFGRIMTARAHELGMSSTTFVNASGLPDEDQVTTARDLSKLAIALYERFPTDYHYFSTKEFQFRGRMIFGHNRLMYRYPGMDGLKTGYTAASGFNLASSAERDGRRLFGVVMGSESQPVRDRLMAKLLDDGFADRPTDPALVAEAAGQNAKVAHRLLAGAERVVAAFSPVSRAEAAPMQGAPPAAKAMPAQAPRWSVQVGASSSEAQAERKADHAADLVGLDDKNEEILAPSHGERMYRARLIALASEKRANEICATLRRHGEKCFVLPPAAGGLRLAGAG
jgi:D-alanyl-D-alanine carboxypeptidase/D-alanyl-D-alanine carboxypeptidase (penicillin-binding protein 5/6)